MIISKILQFVCFVVSISVNTFLQLTAFDDEINSYFFAQHFIMVYYDV